MLSIGITIASRNSSCPSELVFALQSSLPIYCYKTFGIAVIGYE